MFRLKGLDCRATQAQFGRPPELNLEHCQSSKPVNSSYACNRLRKKASHPTRHPRQFLVVRHKCNCWKCVGSMQAIENHLEGL